LNNPILPLIFDSILELSADGDTGEDVVISLLLPASNILPMLKKIIDAKMSDVAFIGNVFFLSKIIILPR
jgi:hypothetical protein